MITTGGVKTGPGSRSRELFADKAPRIAHAVGVEDPQSKGEKVGGSRGSAENSSLGERVWGPSPSGSPHPPAPLPGQLSLTSGFS